MKKKYLKENEEENHFWISISDLMTSLLFIFILILVYTVLSFQQADEEIKGKREQLIKNIVTDLKNENIILEPNYERGSIRISSENLFDKSQFKIKDGQEYIVQKLAISIKNNMKKEDYMKIVNTIFIEGHTDIDNMNDFYFNKKNTSINLRNEELSALRAIEVFHFMNDSANLSDLTNINGESLFSYSGYGSSRPIKGNFNQNEDEKTKNRRIEIFFALNPMKVN